MRQLSFLLLMVLVIACNRPTEISTGKGPRQKFIFLGDPADPDNCPDSIAKFKQDPATFVETASDADFSKYMECAFQGKVLGVRYNQNSDEKNYAILEPDEIDSSLDLNRFISQFGGAHDVAFNMRDLSDATLDSEGCLGGEACESGLVARTANPIPVRTNVVPRNIVPNSPQLDTGKEGGCGVWAAGIANRELGFAWDKAGANEPCPSPNSGDKSGRYMCYRQAEYDALTKELGTTLGATPLVSTAQYYASKGYCSDYRVFGGSDEEYDEVAQALEAGCSIQLSFGKSISTVLDPSSPSFWRDPCYHIENVVGVCLDARTCVKGFQRNCTASRRQTQIDPFWWNGDALPKKAFMTNSWGDFGCISGGTLNDFHHSFTPLFSRTPASPWPPSPSAQESWCWPSDKTDLYVDFICPCTAVWPTEPDLKEFIRDYDLSGAK